jgi:hypothetical protein
MPDTHPDVPVKYRPWIKVVIPFQLLRGQIWVRCLMDSTHSSLHPDPKLLYPKEPGRVKRYQLVLNLLAPPEIYAELPPAVKVLLRVICLIHGFAEGVCWGMVLFEGVGCARWKGHAVVWFDNPQASPCLEFPLKFGVAHRSSHVFSKCRLVRMKEQRGKDYGGDKRRMLGMEDANTSCWWAAGCCV